MKFALPWVLLLLLPLLKILMDHLSRPTGPALRYPSLDTFSSLPATARQRVLPWLFWIWFAALTVLIVAAARPQIKELSSGIPREGVAIELVVDISSSMDISMPFEDESLSRMEVTKKVVEQFAAERPDDLVGLVTFARYADTICPLTLSHDSLQYYIRDLTIESRPNEDGTAFGDAVTLACARLKTAEQRYEEVEGEDAGYTIQSKVVILLTDGSNNCGQHLPMEAASLAESWDIRVHTIAITDPPEMKTIQTPDGPVKIEEDPPVQERILQKMAETTGGIYRRATDDKSLQDVYAEINAMETSEIETDRFHQYVDVFPPLGVAGLILLVLHAVLTTTWLRRAP